MHQAFPGIYTVNKRFFTKNMVPGFKLFREQTLRMRGEEFLDWSPYHSKLAAALKNGLKLFPISPASHVLYLGCAEGKTVQHLSNIVGKTGVIFGVDVSETSMKRFLELCEARENLCPILADATNPKAYADYLAGTKISVLFQDIAQKNQAEIFNANARAFLGKGSSGLIAIKAKSISQGKSPKQVFQEQSKVLQDECEILQQVSLSPFEKDHVVFACRKK